MRNLLPDEVRRAVHLVSRGRLRFVVRSPGVKGPRMGVLHCISVQVIGAVMHPHDDFFCPLTTVTLTHQSTVGFCYVSLFFGQPARRPEHNANVKAIKRPKYLQSWIYGLRHTWIGSACDARSSTPTTKRRVRAAVARTSDGNGDCASEERKWSGLSVCSRHGKLATGKLVMNPRGCILFLVFGSGHTAALNAVMMLL